MMSCVKKVIFNGKRGGGPRKKVNFHNVGGKGVRQKGILYKKGGRGCTKSFFLQRGASVFHYNFKKYCEPMRSLLNVKGVFNSVGLEKDCGDWLDMCISGVFAHCIGSLGKILILARGILGPCVKAPLGQGATDGRNASCV